MSLPVTDVQRDLIDLVRRFVSTEIVPLEFELDPDESELSAPVLERLTTKTKQMGLYNIDVPEEFGGAGLDTVTRTLLAMEMSQHRAGLYAPCYAAFGQPDMGQLYDGTDEQKERYLYPVLRAEKKSFFALTEPSGGSDPARAIQTRAKRDGSDWIINGNKTFISGADTADFGLVFARTGDQESGRSGITCFIVDADTPGFTVRRVIHTLRSGHCPTELTFEDVRVPAAAVLGEVGQGFALATERLTKNRIPYAAGCLGVAMKAHRMAVEYAGTRSVFGSTLAEHEGIQWMLVDNEIDLRSATLITLDAAERADSGQPFRTEVALAKIVATEAAGRVVDRAIQIHGGYGVTKDLPLERWYRELRIRRIGEGSTETQKMIVSRDLLRGRYRGLLDR
ncbi:acyl-CoA dehydrogenase family protein [Kribbella solani]|uniref:Medium-chain specific acyl-CoA dehydrogenase, mitochondrial n=1 Tax=Kribbella solani TaxID=236067 RepID=A0A841DPX2_9ACTN|nr:acyl-CoA dehydrogenase family protein [Kribbella solani]MBB5979941.1 acyl-CoA dehydrogenase [Kribbella solani]MDX3004853.1 acyl-CoA dehydrogenase family protein [Kribbella solani]